MTHGFVLNHGYGHGRALPVRCSMPFSFSRGYTRRCLLVLRVKIFSTPPPESIVKKPKHPLRGLLSDIGFDSPHLPDTKSTSPRQDIGFDSNLRNILTCLPAMLLDPARYGFLWNSKFCRNLTRRVPCKGHQHNSIHHLLTPCGTFLGSTFSL